MCTVFPQIKAKVFIYFNHLGYQACVRGRHLLLMSIVIRMTSYFLTVADLNVSTYLCVHTYIQNGL